MHLKNMNKSRIFIFPYYNINPTNLINTYLYNEEYDNEKLHDYFYVEVENSNVDRFKNNPHYVSHYHTEHNSIMIVLNIPEDLKLIVTLFKQGRFSEFPKDYIENNFKAILPNGSINMNLRILKKDTIKMPSNILPIKEYWEIVLDTKLPNNAELLGKPVMRQESFRYKKVIDLSIYEESIRSYLETKLACFEQNELDNLKKISQKKKFQDLFDKQLKEYLVPMRARKFITEILLTNNFNI